MSYTKRKGELQLSKGAQIYTNLTLSIYDILVHKISNKFAWQCDTKNILDLYNEKISTHHCDIGVGTGYFLDKCTSITPKTTITLIDLNHNCLNKTAERISRYHPKLMNRDILNPLDDISGTFDSVAITYLIHCLSAPVEKKRLIFGNIASIMNKGGTLFGATILNMPKNILAKKLMHFYNKKGVFSNTDDTLEFLRTSLETHFKAVSIELYGTVALFSGIKK